MRSIFQAFLKTLIKLTALFYLYFYIVAHNLEISINANKITLFLSLLFNLLNFLTKKDDLIKKGLTKNNAIGRIREFYF